MIRFFLGTLLGAFLGYAMGSYAMLARPLSPIEPIGLSDAEVERRTRPAHWNGKACALGYHVIAGVPVLCEDIIDAAATRPYVDALLRETLAPNVIALALEDELELDGVRQRLAVVRLNGA